MSTGRMTAADAESVVDGISCDFAPDTDVDGGEGEASNGVPRSMAVIPAALPM